MIDILLLKRLDLVFMGIFVGFWSWTPTKKFGIMNLRFSATITLKICHQGHSTKKKNQVTKIFYIFKTAGRLWKGILPKILRVFIPSDWRIKNLHLESRSSYREIVKSTKDMENPILELNLLPGNHFILRDWRTEKQDLRTGNYSYLLYKKIYFRVIVQNANR